MHLLKHFWRSGLQQISSAAYLSTYFSIMLQLVMSSIDTEKIAPGLLIIVNFLWTQLLSYASFHTFAAMWSSENFERSIFIHIF